MHIAPRARPASSRASRFHLPAVAAGWLLLATLAGCGEAGGHPISASPDADLLITPTAPRVGVGAHLTLRAQRAYGPVAWQSLDGEVARVDAAGTVTGVAPGRARVVAATGSGADTVQVAVTGSSLVSGPGWSIADDGATVEVENPVLRLRFAYAAAGVDGWFSGGESSGGGGRDGGIVEMYYKPTSPTRNLVFRNGQWGSLYDQMDSFEAEGISDDRADHDAPDFGSGRDATMISHRVYESAGRLVAEFEFQFRAWRIRRTYLVYPWGDLSVHVKVTQTESGRFNYLAHRFLFAASRAGIAAADAEGTRDWGTNFQADREMMHAWSDGAPTYEYVEPIRDAVDRNTVLFEAGRSDAYSGFMLDDRNGNDPDIVVMNGDRRIDESPFQTVSSRFGGHQYVETALFSPRWAPDNLTHADMTWFYLGTRCCEVRWSDAPTWETSLGSWEESFHVLLRQDLEPEDYLALWRARAGALAEGAPRNVHNAVVRLDGTDRQFHLQAEAGAATVSWDWTRTAAADRRLDYRTAFVVEGLDPSAVRIEGKSPPDVTVHRDPSRGQALVVLSGEQPAEPETYRITLTR
jgi:hypothetical protein